jgi:hypothetical protein
MIIQFPVFAPPSPRIASLDCPHIVPQWVRDFQQAQAQKTAYGVQSRRKT